MKIHILILFLMIFINNTRAQTVTTMTLSGTDWNNTQGAADIGEAGTDFNGTLESISNQNMMNIQYTVKLLGLLGLSAKSWRVDVQKSDILWHNSLQIYARRIGGTPDNGLLDLLSNPSSISGGTVYQNTGDAPATLFSGAGKVDNISLQYKLSGISLALPAGDYETEIIYTLWDN